MEEEKESNSNQNLWELEGAPPIATYSALSNLLPPLSPSRSRSPLTRESSLGSMACSSPTISTKKKSHFSSSAATNTPAAESDTSTLTPSTSGKSAWLASHHGKWLSRLESSVELSSDTTEPVSAKRAFLPSLPALFTATQTTSTKKGYSSFRKLDAIPYPVCIIDGIGLIAASNLLFRERIPVPNDATMKFLDIIENDCRLRIFSGIAQITNKTSIHIQVDNVKTMGVNGKGHPETAVYSWTLTPDIQRGFILAAVSVHDAKAPASSGVEVQSDAFIAVSWDQVKVSMKPGTLLAPISTTTSPRARSSSPKEIEIPDADVVENEWTSFKIKTQLGMHSPSSIEARQRVWDSVDRDAVADVSENDEYASNGEESDVVLTSTCIEPALSLDTIEPEWARPASPLKFKLR